VSADDRVVGDAPAPNDAAFGPHPHTFADDDGARNDFTAARRLVRVVIVISDANHLGKHGISTDIYAHRRGNNAGTTYEGMVADNHFTAAHTSDESAGAYFDVVANRDTSPWGSLDHDAAPKSNTATHSDPRLHPRAKRSRLCRESRQDAPERGH
jgi:hypothetical protein